MTKVIKKIAETKKEVAAVILKNPEVEKQLGLLRGAAEIGVKKTGKGLVVFYERSTRIGEIVKEAIFVLFGLSILLAGLLTTPADLLTLWNIVARLEGGLIGRIIVVIVGIGLFSFGVSKLLATLKLAEVIEKKEKYKQKKLTE